MTLSDTIARGVTAYLGARVVNVVANAVLLFVLTRYLLDPAGYGTLYFALSVLSIAALFGMAGLPKATGRYVTEFVATDESQVPHVVGRSLTFLLALACVVGVVVALGHGVIADLLGDPSLAPFFVVGGGYVVARGLSTYLANVFQGFNRVDYSAVLNAVNGVGRVVFAVAFILLGLGPLGALVGYTVGYLLAVAVGFVVLYRYVLPAFDRATDRDSDLSRRILAYSVPTAATRASVVLDSKVDTVLVGVLVGPVAVGYYTLAGQIADFVVVPAQSLGFTISPALGDQHAADETDRAAALYERAMENVLLLYLPAAVGLMLVAEPAVRFVFGTRYLGAVPVLQLFAVFVVVRAVHKITGNGLDYLGLARVRAVARGTTAVGNVGLNLLLIPTYGIVGAAVATIVTYSTYTAINVLYIHRELGLPVAALAGQAARVAVVALAMGAAVGLALPHVSGLVTLGAAVALGIGVWAGLSVASGLLDVGEVRSFLA